MSSVLGVVFDVDGVLVDSGDAHRRAWRRLGEEVGVPFGDDLFARTFGQRNASIIPIWLGEEVATTRLDALGGRKEEIYRDLVGEGCVRVYAGVGEILADLRRAGWRTAVATSGPRANAELIVDVLGARDLFDATVAAEDVTEGKPHPEAFLTAARLLRIPPACCAVVEDSVHGIEAARRAGMLAVAVLTSTPRERLEEAGAEMVIGEVGDLRVAAVRKALAVRPA